MCFSAENGRTRNFDHACCRNDSRCDPSASCSCLMACIEHTLIWKQTPNYIILSYFSKASCIAWCLSMQHVFCGGGVGSVVNICLPHIFSLRFVICISMSPALHKTCTNHQAKESRLQVDTGGLINPPALGNLSWPLLPHGPFQHSKL